IRVHIINLYRDDVGNSAVPEKLKQGEKESAAVVSATAAGARRRKAAWIVAALLAAIALAIGFWVFSHRGSQKLVSAPIENPCPVAAGERKIAVLPFKPITPENRDPVSEMGMADTVVAKLST